MTESQKTQSILDRALEVHKMQIEDKVLRFKYSEALKKEQETKSKKDTK